MKKEWIPLMIKTGKLKMGFTDLLTHYLLIFFLLTPLAWNVFSFIQKHVFHNYQGVRNPEETFTLTLSFGLVAVLFYFIQNNRLKFTTIETNLSRENIRAVINQTAHDLEWHLEVNNDKMVIARTHPKWWTGSWGEQITIIIDNPRIMINSICDPNKKTSVISMGRNKKNINNLIENIKSANQ